MRNKLFAIIVIASLVYIGVFGYMGLGFANHVSAACPVSVFTGDCSSAALVEHHITAIRSLTSGILTASVVVAVFALVLFRRKFFIFDAQEKNRFLPALLKVRYVYLRIKERSPHRKFLCWLTSCVHIRDKTAFMGRDVILVMI